MAGSNPDPDLFTSQLYDTRYKSLIQKVGRVVTAAGHIRQKNSSTNRTNNTTSTNGVMNNFEATASVRSLFLEEEDDIYATEETFDKISKHISNTVDAVHRAANGVDRENVNASQDKNTDDGFDNTPAESSAIYVDNRKSDNSGKRKSLIPIGSKNSSALGSWLVSGKQNLGNIRQFSVGPVKVTFNDIWLASVRIAENEGVRRTPCGKSVNLSSLLDMDVYLKRDYMQVTGSFKERGARNTLLLLSEREKRAGVITASAGNHGLALAYHGNDLNIPVTVCMPVNAPIMKIQQCKLYKAHVHTIGADIIEAKAHAMVMADAKDLSYINGYDHPFIIAGQGTCGIEIHEQVPDIDAVVVPIGGGGLIAGCAIALKHLNPNIEIIGVESDQSASFKAAKEAGEPVCINVNQSLTLADGLCVSKVGHNAFSNANPLIDRLVQVDEASIAVAVLRLVEEEKCVVEGAGATGLAAAVAGLLPELKGKRVVFPLCGGNIDTSVLGRVLDRGLAGDGRLVKFTVVLTDRPGGLSDLISYISGMGASIKDIFSERAWLKTSIHTVRNKVIIEVRDADHGIEIRDGLAQKYETLKWGNEKVETKDLSSSL